MTGTNGFGVKSALRAVVCLALTVPTHGGDGYIAAPMSEQPYDRFSAALADELPPAQYGTYQYVTPPSRLPQGYGFQFADPQPDQSDAAANATGPEVRQTQYPLDEPLDPPVAPPSAPFVPPTLGPTVSASPEPDGWAVQSQFLSDLTHVIGSGNTFGITTWTGRLVLETPRLPGVSVRPHFGWHLLHGPGRTDLPAQLYDASLEARMYWPFHDRVIGEFALAPSVFSDFQNTSSDALRIVGRAVGYFLWSPDVRFAGGATYLDRQDILVLPIAGVIWTPTPDHRLELLFPQPRIAHRYHHDAHHERWVFLSGELGGGSWAIERSSGADDVISYRDLRLMTGVEWKYRDKSSWRIEGGYVFGRELEYVSRVGDYKPSNTSMIRAALVY